MCIQVITREKDFFSFKYNLNKNMLCVLRRFHADFFQYSMDDEPFDAMHREASTTKRTKSKRDLY